MPEKRGLPPKQPEKPDLAIESAETRMLLQKIGEILQTNDLTALLHLIEIPTAAYVGLLKNVRSLKFQLNTEDSRAKHIKALQASNNNIHRYFALHKRFAWVFRDAMIEKLPKAEARKLRVYEQNRTAINRLQNLRPEFVASCNQALDELSVLLQKLIAERKKLKSAAEIRMLEKIDEAVPDTYLSSREGIDTRGGLSGASPDFGDLPARGSKKSGADSNYD